MNRSPISNNKLELPHREDKDVRTRESKELA